MAALFQPVRTPVFANAALAPGAVVYFYVAGTSTPKSVYGDPNLTTALGTSVTADANGSLPAIFLDADIELYKYRIEDADGVLIDEQDGYGGAAFNVKETYASMVAQRLLYIDSIPDLLALNTAALQDGQQVSVAGFYPGAFALADPVSGGSGVFVWASDVAKSSHNGGTVISPTVPWDGTIATFEDFLTGTGETSPTGTGAFVRLDQDDITPLSFGATPDDDSADTLSANNAALQTYVEHCLLSDRVQDYRGHSYHYDTTLDMTGGSNRTAKMVGDCEDANNVGRYNLIYHGDGRAILARELLHFMLGLAGTGWAGDSVPATSVGIEVSESMKHLNSCIRNFDKAYAFTGGYYHEVRGGRIQRCRTLYDFGSLGLYNFTVDAQHTDFVNGIVSNGGNGPVRIGGSWEKFTGQILTYTAGTPKYKIILDNPYIENYPASTVVNGLTGNPADTYTTNRYFLTGQSSVSGRALVFVNGCTTEIVRATSGFPVLDLDLTLFGSTLPSRLVYGPYATSLDFKADYVDDFSAIPVFAGGISADNSFGTYSDTDGEVKRLETNLGTSLTNGWAVVALSDYPKTPTAKINGNTVELSMVLDGSAATADTVVTLDPAFRPANDQKFVVATNAGTATLDITNAGIVSTASRSRVFVSVTMMR